MGSQNDQKLTGRRRARLLIVTIEESPINIILSTKECNRRGTGLANFNEKEKRIIELWNKHLADETVVPGRLIAFLSQLDRLV